jgi:DNA-directed RNA polymerase specialized sigma subunit
VFDELVEERSKGVMPLPENEKKKAYLLSYKAYKQKQKRLEEQLEELRQTEMSPSLIVSDMPGAHNQRDLSDYAAKYDVLWNQIIKARKDTIERFTEIQQQIELMEDGNEKTLLTLRYLRHKKWEDIAEEMAYTWQHVHKIHANALKNFKMR